MVTIDQLHLRATPQAETPPGAAPETDEERLRDTIREIIREELERLTRLEAR
jgi:hypothetical protein